MKGIVSALIVAFVAVAANECPQDWEHEEKLLVHDDCHKFYMCTYGEPVEMTCWGDLYFNVETGQCDWQSNVDCGDRNIPAQNFTTTDATPTTESVTDATTTAAPTTTAAAPTTTTAAPSTTTRKPTTTATAAPTTDALPVTSTITTTAPTTTEVATEAPTTSDPGFLENGCPVDPHIHWLLPVEGDCNGFYYCVWGELVQRACPSTLHFNPTIQVCDWPENAGCAATTTAAPTTTTAAPTMTTAAPSTTTRKPTTPTTAAPTTNALPVTSTVTTTAPTTTEVATKAPTTSDAGFLENGCPVDPHIHWLLPVEGDCNGFYYCVWGELVQRACPSTLHFNPTIQVCDWPENAGCVAARSLNKHKLASYYQ